MTSKTTEFLKKAYVTPSSRYLSMVSEVNFLASAGGEDMDPSIGAWDEYNF